MAISYVNLTGAQRGVAADEAGINVETFEVEFENPKEFLKNKDGQRRGFATNIDPSATIKVKGEILGTGGLQGATFTTALTISNSTAGFGITTGGIYLDKAKISEGREAWKSLEIDATKLPLIP